MHLNYYDTILYRAKIKNPTEYDKEWTFGIPYDNTPLYCFKSDQTDSTFDWKMLSPGFADWGMPRQMESVDIDYKTLSQYIGFEDSNNTRIFVYDIVRFYIGKFYKDVLIWWNNEDRIIIPVRFEDMEYNGLDYYNSLENSMVSFSMQLRNLYEDYTKIEVVGNYFDNKDMIDEAVKKNIDHNKNDKFYKIPLIIDSQHNKDNLDQNNETVIGFVNKNYELFSECYILRKYLQKEMDENLRTVSEHLCLNNQNEEKNNE